MSDAADDIGPARAAVRLEWVPLALAVAALFLVLAAPFVNELVAIGSLAPTGVMLP